MKLDRYSSGIPRFRVFRHVETPGPQAGVRIEAAREVLLQDKDGHWYREVDPWECFVLKRRDMVARLMLWFGGFVASTLGDGEYGQQLKRLGEEWQAKTLELDDSKMPD